MAAPVAVRTPMCTGPLTRPNQSADGSVAERVLEQSLFHRSAPIDTERPPHGSVDRDCAGRNATSVKVVEPRQSCPFRGGRARTSDRLNSGHAEAASALLFGVGTTGVQDHSMYRRLVTERKRSAPSRTEAKRPWSRANGQGVMSKSGAILRAEVRCPHSSGEAGQLPWSEGGHGE